MTSRKGKPQPKYSIPEKAKAVARLYAEGYPEKPGALRKISKELGISHPTLSRWASGGKSAPDLEVIKIAVSSMMGVIEGELEKILGSMQKVRDKADYRTLAVAFGILFDKYQLIRGAPTSRTSSLREDLSDKSTDELERIISDADKLVEETFEKMEAEVDAKAS